MNVGVIGLGVGAHHVRTCLAHSNVDRVVVCDLDPSKAGEWAADDRVVVAAGDGALLSRDDLDLVVVASYDEHHTDQAVAALEAGNHVFVEKPLCLTMGESRRLQAAVRGSGQRLSSNLGLRTCPLFQEVRGALREGEFGSVFSMEAEYFWGRPQKLTHGWRRNTPGYSVIHGAAVHMVDLLLWLSGQRPVRVQALGNARALENAALEFEDFVSLHLHYADKTVARVTASGGCAHPHFHRLAVYGSKRSFRNDLDGGMWIDGAGARRADGEYPAKECRGQVLHTFLDAVSAHGRPMVDEREVFDVMDICLTAQQSLERGQPLNVNYSYESGKE